MYIINHTKVILAFLLLITVACSKTETHSDKITVSISSENREDNKVNIKGLFNIWERSELDAKDGSGMILIEKETQVPELLYLSTPTSIEYLWCYLESGDSINIHVVGDHVVFSGNSLVVEQNNLLQQIREERMRLRENKKELTLSNSENVNDSITEKHEVHTYSDIYKNTGRLIDDFKKRVTDYSIAFMRFIEIDQKYYRIQNELNLKIRQSQTYQNFSENELKILHETIEDSKIDEAIYSSYFRRILKTYVDYLRIHDPKQLLGDGKEYILNEVRLADYVENPFIRNYIVTGNLLSLVFQENSNAEFIEAVENYGGQWKDFLLQQVQTAEANSEDSVTPDREFPDFNAVDVYGDSTSLSEYYGKWIYLEVWTTWSGQSNLEVQYFNELENRLQNYPVEFICVSVDNIRDKQKWSDFVLKYKLGGTHLFCAHKKKLYSELGVTAVPHFAIIDPEGKLVYNKAPRPSSGIPERLLKALAGE